MCLNDEAVWSNDYKGGIRVHPAFTPDFKPKRFTPAIEMPKLLEMDSQAAHKKSLDETVYLASKDKVLDLEEQGKTEEKKNSPDSVMSGREASSESIILDLVDSLQVGSTLSEMLRDITEAYTVYSANYPKALLYLTNLRKLNSKLTKKVIRGNYSEGMGSISSVIGLVGGVGGIGGNTGTSSGNTGNYNNNSGNKNGNINLQVSEIIKAGEKDRRMRRLELSAFLLTPIQRLTRYPLLFRSILRYTRKHNDPDEKDEVAVGDNEDYFAISQAIMDLEEIVTQVNNRAAKRASDYVMEELQERLYNIVSSVFIKDCFIGPTLVMGQRRLIMEGQLTKVYSRRMLYLFLFNDMLMVTTMSIPSSSPSLSVTNSIITGGGGSSINGINTGGVGVGVGSGSGSGSGGGSGTQPRKGGPVYSLYYPIIEPCDYVVQNISASFGSKDRVGNSSSKINNISNNNVSSSSVAGNGLGGGNNESSSSSYLISLYLVKLQKQVYLKSYNRENAKNWVNALRKASDDHYNAVCQSLRDGVHVGFRNSIMSCEMREKYINRY
ncbi:Intersectin-2 [Zancudomyces culisetae]|uniref:Intersectin-2 n=1 Tax=Zancudomyces culisetae TaxID=1213189 RepID=A0A1R1PM00_ZANCU|nr:Intersectin-2 [Zancudomyces culisetae]|eukprot:OMH81998.1 Intersectin-2 [Zancudomyces culisetae]